jgi:hypothetical protein
VSGGSSLVTGLVVIAALVGLIAFIIRGGAGRLGQPSAKGFGRPGGKRPAREAGNRTPFEVFFAVFAVANLAISPSASQQGAPLIALAMVLLVVAYALFTDLGLLIVLFGAVAAVCDAAVTEGPDAAVAVFIVAALLAWIFGAARMLAGR